MYRPPNRPWTPALPVTAYTTYGITVPLSSHWRAATCAEVDCDRHLNGWVSVIDEATDLGQRQAAYIRRDSGRAFREEKRPDGLTAFTFEPGQRCFASADHRVRLDRPEIFTARGGDHRAATTDVRRFDRHDQWLEQFAENQDRIRTVQERG